MNVKVRLDRVVVTESWSSWFPEVKLQHLVTSRSDHLPIWLEVEHDVYRR
jgi:endonuclease/exonuclease/phosphatase family metal-dependent hydrolase